MGPEACLRLGMSPATAWVHGHCRGRATGSAGQGRTWMQYHARQEAGKGQLQLFCRMQGRPTTGDDSASCGGHEQAMHSGVLCLLSQGPEALQQSVWGCCTSAARPPPLEGAVVQGVVGVAIDEKCPIGRALAAVHFWGGLLTGATCTEVVGLPSELVI